MALSLKERQEIEKYGRQAEGRVPETMSYMQEARRRGEIDYIPSIATISKVLSALGIYQPSSKGRHKKPSIVEVTDEVQQSLRPLQDPVDRYSRLGKVLSAGRVGRRVGKRLCYRI